MLSRSNLLCFRELLPAQLGTGTHSFVNSCAPIQTTKTSLIDNMWSIIKAFLSRRQILNIYSPKSVHWDTDMNDGYWLTFWKEPRIEEVWNCLGGENPQNFRTRSSTKEITFPECNYMALLTTNLHFNCHGFTGLNSILVKVHFTSERSVSGYGTLTAAVQMGIFPFQ